MSLAIYGCDPAYRQQLTTYLSRAGVVDCIYCDVCPPVGAETTPILCVGEDAWAAVGGPTPHDDWWGYTHPDHPGVYTLPALSELKENPKLIYPTIKQCFRLKQWLDGAWPRPLPPIRPLRDVEDLHTFYAGVGKARWVTVDTEYVVQKPGVPGRLTLIGLWYQGAPFVLSVWWPTIGLTNQFRDMFLQIVTSTPVVMWNAVADIPVIEAAMGVGYGHYKRVDDPMLRHALLWSESPHGLEYCASIDGCYPKLKHLMDTDLVTYNAGDVLETDHLEEVYRAQIEADRPLHDLYEQQSLKLIPIILKSRTMGIKVDGVRACNLIHQYQSLVEETMGMATAACGWPINLSSPDQLKHWLYTHCGYETQHKKAKGKKTVSTNEDALNALRATYSLPFEAEYEEKEGLSLAYILQRIDEGADPLLEAVACYRGAVGVLNNYLYGVCQDVYEAKTDAEAKRARERLKIHSVGLSDIADRIYPEMKIHAQANGRWSITNPPVAGMPKELHSMLVPDEGQAWISWDFKQIEPRIGAAMSQDWPRLKAFEQGRDIYQDGCLEAFGKFSKVLRQLFKQVDLSLSYGKKPRNLWHIPGIMAYGFTKAQLEQAAWNYLRAHPQRTKWMEGIEAQVKTTHEIRDWKGRLRRLQGHPDNQVREALNMPMQAGVTSYTNEVVVKIAEALPYATLITNIFDSQWWSVPVDKVEEACHTIKHILGAQVIIQGIIMTLPYEPAGLEVRYG